jgi:ribosomal protein L5
MNKLAEFRKEKAADLGKKLGVKNVNSVPKIEKVIVAV